MYIFRFRFPWSFQMEGREVMLSGCPTSVTAEQSISCSVIWPRRSDHSHVHYSSQHKTLNTFSLNEYSINKNVWFRNSITLWAWYINFLTSCWPKLLSIKLHIKSTANMQNVRCTILSKTAWKATCPQCIFSMHWTELPSTALVWPAKEIAHRHFTSAWESDILGNGVRFTTVREILVCPMLCHSRLLWQPCNVFAACFWISRTVRRWQVQLFPRLKIVAACIPNQNIICSFIIKTNADLGPDKFLLKTYANLKNKRDSAPWITRLCKPKQNT